MTAIEHRDRTGKLWVFGIDGTRAQLDAIRAALACVRNMRTRPPCSISALTSAEHNAPVFDAVEAAILEGLAARFPAPEPPTPTAPLYVARAGTLSPSEPKANQRTEAGTLGGDVSPADAFWWEML